MFAQNDILFTLASEGLQLKRTSQSTIEEIAHQKNIPWTDIISVASMQGLVAITYDGLKEWMKNPDFKATFPKPMLLQWGMATIQTENQYKNQWNAAKFISDFYFHHEIKTVVLKGFAVGQYYPMPTHRACGDMDCFLMGDYERGNHLVEEKGVVVARDFYKHSEFDIKGLHIENHQFCTAIRGSKKAKRFEKLLQDLLYNNQLTTIGDSRLLCPPPLFNALFLTKHAMVHFLSEGITLRHYADWSMFVEKNRDKIDWNQFLEICKEYDLHKFVDAFTGLCSRIYQLKSPFDIQSSQKIQELILEDTLSLQDKTRVCEGSFWKQRFQLIKNTFDDNWKYKFFSDESFAHALFRLWKGYVFDRNPKI